jgi:hypothetical protein
LDCLQSCCLAMIWSNSLQYEHAGIPKKKPCLPNEPKTKHWLHHFQSKNVSSYRNWNEWDRRVTENIHEILVHQEASQILGRKGNEGQRATDDEDCVSRCSPSSTTSCLVLIKYSATRGSQLRKAGYVYGSADSRISPVPFPFDGLHMLFNDVTLTSENT